MLMILPVSFLHKISCINYLSNNNQAFVIMKGSLIMQTDTQ